MIDLYTIFWNFPELKGEIFSYFDKYDYDRNIAALKIISRSFYYLPMYNKLTIDKQSKSSISNFLKNNNIKTLIIRKNNSLNKLYKISKDLLKSVNKIKIDPILCNYELSTKELFFLFKFFSDLKITNLKFNYCTCILPNNLINFNKLVKLDINITSKDNEDLVFNLLTNNKNTLRKLKIGIYTGRNIDEQKLIKIIEDNLLLEFLEIRGDLFSYKMINPKMKYIRSSFKYNSNYVNTLKYILSLRLYDLTNIDFEVLCSTLELVEHLSLCGVSANIDSIIYTSGHKYEKILYGDYDEFNDNFYKPYDFSKANIYIKSKNLKSIYLYSFTIDKFKLSNPDILTSMTIEDICFLKQVYLPKLNRLYVHNYDMNPENFNINKFKLPKLKDLSMLHCLVTTPFVYNCLNSLNIQTSIIDVNILHILKKHKNLEEILFYHNFWSESYDKVSIEKYLKNKRIDYYDKHDW